jgi:hypothetical protein
LLLARPGCRSGNQISIDELIATPVVLSEGIHRRIEALSSRP